MASTLVQPVANDAARRSLSFSEYSDHYEHQRRGCVRDAAPTVLDWEIGSLPAQEDCHRESVSCER